MKYLDKLVLYLSNFTSLSNKYILSICQSLIVVFIIKMLAKTFEILNNKFNTDDKNKYILNKRVKLICSIIIIFCLILVWQDYFKDFLTLISVVSAALTLAVRDIVVNFFSGIYIKVAKPFRVEDRISIGNYIGDVINISILSFEILEVRGEENAEQSTGIIIQVPASKIFTEYLKNYSKAFKYVWKEMSIKVPIDNNVPKVKKELYRIIRSNQTVSSIPNKMEKQLDNAAGEYRIYYNKLEPIIYIEIIDDYVLLTIRFLVHPKKVRNVENEIWNQVLNSVNNGKIKLYSVE